MKTVQIYSAIYAVLFVAVGTAFSQDECVALLQHGIYNTVRSEQTGSQASTIYSQLCSSYNAYKAGTLQAGANGSYGLYSGGASFSKAEVESIGQAMCSTNYSNDEAVSQLSNFSSIVSAEGLSAFNSCVSNSRAGLVVKTNFDEYAPELLSINARYVPNGAAGDNHAHTVQIQDSSPDASHKVICSGTLYDLAQNGGKIEQNVNYTIVCRRPVENDPSRAFAIAGRPGGIAFPAQITIQTDISPIRFLFGAIYLPPPPLPITSAVGDVVSSFLKPEAFEGQHKGQKWVLADGRAVPGTMFEQLVGPKVPDLRGVFLRGINSGRTDEYKDPDGERIPGALQKDALQDHVHNTGLNPRTDWPSSGYAATKVPASAEGTLNKKTGGVENASAASETRPKNAAIYFYIRVN